MTSELRRRLLAVNAKLARADQGAEDARRELEELLREARRNGASAVELGRLLGLSAQRVSQIAPRRP